MKENNQCPKCGGTNVIADAKLVDRGDVNAPAEMFIATFRADGAATRRHTSAANVRVCADCGYVEIYAVNPEYLHPPQT